MVALSSTDTSPLGRRRRTQVPHSRFLARPEPPATQLLSPRPTGRAGACCPDFGVPPTETGTEMFTLTRAGGGSSCWSTCRSGSRRHRLGGGSRVPQWSGWMGNVAAARCKLLRVPPGDPLGRRQGGEPRPEDARRASCSRANLTTSVGWATPTFRATPRWTWCHRSASTPAPLSR